LAKLRRLNAAVVALVLALSSAAAATTTTRVGALRELAIAPAAHISLFGIAPGPGGDLWFADQGCLGHGHCAIGRENPDDASSLAMFRRGLNHGSIPYAIAAGPRGDVWFTDGSGRSRQAAGSPNTPPACRPEASPSGSRPAPVTGCGSPTTAAAPAASAHSAR
jgi:streptogramin lyase